MPRFQGLEVIEDGVAALRVDTYGGLVQQKDLRIMQERCGQVETALHAAAEVSDAVLGAVGEADQIQRFADRRLAAAPSRS